ncbi:MAG TPA: LysM peptidoglycan-binding domain-containing protein [Vicinamibacterales bacterium]|nr:LysM peptidoglycan-binding domain-containing protein [Vicinamibacterales bacterium]
MPTGKGHGLKLAVCAWAIVATACASRVPGSIAEAPTPNPTTSAPAEPASHPPVATDPVAELIALSERHFETGRRELDQGHLAAARGAFDRALEVILESPYGAASDPRIREQFDRLVERISAYELTALAQGDGFAEQATEPASIDEVLAITTFEQPQPTPETTQAVTEDLKETLHDIEIPLNAKVLSFVELLTGRLRDYLREGLSRGAQYLPMIQAVFRAEGLPLDLAYVPLIESAFKPNAVSRAKARGIWQFMRGTGLENGLRHDWYIDERADPEKATRAAARYLKTLYEMFDGDWHLALAAYNGGPGRVQRAMKRSGRKDFWSLSASSAYLPRETRDYVPLILAAVIIARNPAQYGIDVEPFEPRRYETVELSRPVDLRWIAEWTGAPVQLIQELNPELRRWTTPIRDTEYELRVPAGTAELVRTALDAIPADELPPLNRYTVKRGETLTSIARKLKVSVTDLAQANYLSTRARLKVGQQLIIPRAPRLLLTARGREPEALVAARSTDAVRASAVSEPAVDAEPARIVHRVKRGETLFSIARLYRTSVTALKEWNRLRGNTIQAGQRLTILKPRTVATN